ncbi:winged helix-turn-helix domain-containing protein [Gephyromycinifex aptenodytis]|uniref:winged helix-turn-helix domain-containing protein n=1 Tax=Gephyromycinifex aptenodytis TaxID=2716227 RepID=UPI001D01FA02|nr:crosslink repair DNA glycosylase YcaQ family protein [Gephyromycinifex aptenodytis]
MRALSLQSLQSLSTAEARRIALEAQGFGARHRPRGRVGAQALRRVLDRLGVVQIDSVNAVCRSQYLPFFSRLGNYDTLALDRLRDDSRARYAVEYWAHEASLVPMQTWPLYGFRMRRAQDQWGSMRRVAQAYPDLVRVVAEQVRQRGPLTAAELESILRHDIPARSGQWGWNWSAVKSALEHLFWTGRLTSAGRTRTFARRYADPQIVLPTSVLERGPYGAHPIPDQECFTGLMELAGRALGIGTEQCLRDYARLTPAQARPALQRLVEEGTLQTVAVQGWRRPAYLHRYARVPSRTAHVDALLSPFDSLIWQRDRTRALFGFDYRLEIYVPAAKRVHGYYVLPFLCDGALVARVDLKADRGAGVLRVNATHWEPGAHNSQAQQRLTDQLRQLADFLQLEQVADQSR